ncbi:MAG TPA: DASS family sodium-coupled anion symporter, partial [Fodinibius sp.]|nr:DASS family sodium-coupled anion symporter [Fodinibius sp.]
MKETSSLLRKRLGFASGIIVFLVLLFMSIPEGLSPEGWRTAAVAALMAVWWITEALPIAVTALIPVVLVPALNIAPVAEATAPYANPLIFLFMGGFIIAIAMQRWDLHRRIALNIVSYVGVKPSSIILGFILASAFLSMWVSNTATALMMLPIALSILHLVEDQKEDGEKLNFELVLVLSIAYACNIGGMGTLIGTPPNALLAGFMSENYGYEIGFAQWMMLGVPLMVIALPLLYLLLVKVIYPIKLRELPGGKKLIQSQLNSLGTMGNAEKRVATVFCLTALMWISRPMLTGILPGLSDAGIAVGAAVLLFVIPAGAGKRQFLLSWPDAEK